MKVGGGGGGERENCDEIVRTRGTRLKNRFLTPWQPCSFYTVKNTVQKLHHKQIK